jgi:hypothetical protein
MFGKTNMEGRQVGLDFYDLLIEVKSGTSQQLTSSFTSARLPYKLARGLE